MEHVSVNFHYVGVPKFPFEGIHSLSLEEFSSRIKKIARDYELVSLRTVIRAVRGEGGLPEKSCLLTFDDGLSSQYEIPFQYLKKEKIPAAFFALSGPLQNGKPATVHQVQWLRAHVGEVKLISLINDISEEQGLGISLNNVDSHRAKESYRYDTDEVAQLKYLLNYVLESTVLESLLNTIFIRERMDIEAFTKDFYMNEEMLSEIASEGYLGSHAETHRPLAKLTAQEAKRELSKSKKFLEQVTQSTIEAISYPLGNPEAVNEKTGVLARECGYVLGYTMERKKSTLLSKNLLLPRFDVSDLEKLGVVKEK